MRASLFVLLSGMFVCSLALTGCSSSNTAEHPMTVTPRPQDGLVVDPAPDNGNSTVAPDPGPPNP